MNMKKTIAAIAAGAMAVSAMATTVSAVQDQTLNYNLVRTHKENTSGKVTLTATFNDVTVSDGKLVVKVAIPDINYTWGGSATSAKPAIKSISVTGRYTTDNKAIIPITRSADANAENYSPTVKDGYLEIAVGSGELLASGEPITFTVSAEIEHNLKDDWTDLELINKDIIAGNIWIGYENAAYDATHTAADYKLGDVVAKDFSKTSKKPYKVPFQTGPNGNVNIVAYIQQRNVRDDGKDEFDWDGGYKNVLPVLNDAIANYETITFTFNTAKDGIRWVANGNYGKLYGTDEAVGGYNAALAAAGGNAANVTPVYDNEWNADKSYTSFTQHLYNGTNAFYGAGSGWESFAAGEDYLGFDWAGQNLFGGALVINENLTMSLSDVDYFVWKNSSLSFDWDAVMDGAATSNNYATYVQSIKLATSTIWYWDSMDVTLAAGEGGDAASDAGTPGEEDELDDEEIDDEIIDDEIIDDEEEEEEEDEPAPEVVEVATTPATGNAPVALAVIPVALAAAAIVAKKRG